MKIPSLKEMLEHGVHFGHQVSRWHPKMDPYIFGVKNGIHIINLEKSVVELEKALNYMKNVTARGGVILFVGTKRQAQEIIEKGAKDCQMPYVNQRWLGGLLTNFPVLLKLIRKYKDLKSKQESGKLGKYTKKEQLKFSREIEHLEGMVGGISSLDKIPDAIFILDLKREKTAFTEALKKQVKVVAVCDTNIDPTNVDYPIPANDDATKSIKFVTGLVVGAIKEGRTQKKSAPQVQERKANPTADKTKKANKK